jgi:hypothetical protein
VGVKVRFKLVGEPVRHLGCADHGDDIEDLDEIACDRVCQARDPSERGGAGHYQDANPFRRGICAARHTVHPVGRLGEISDIVDVILYLEGASFVTGEILHVDGGQSAGH